LGLRIGTDERLADRYYGEWAGVSVREVIARWGSLDAAPGVEPASEVRDRALAALADIAESARGATVVVVSHDAVNRIALAALDRALGEADQVPQDTGCFNVLDCHSSTGGDVRWDVVRINQVPPEVPEPTAPVALDQER
jgi:broad specificity phosphatase PhoE